MVGIIAIIVNGAYDKDGLKYFIFSALYPVSVPAWSVYLSCREIFLGEDWTVTDNLDFNLTYMKVLKVLEHIGEFCVPNN